MRPSDVRRTVREARIVDLRASGLSQRSIAASLKTSPATVSRALVRADRRAQERMRDRAVEYLAATDARLETIIERAFLNHLAAEKAHGTGRAPTRYLALALTAMQVQGRLLGLDRVPEAPSAPREPLDLSQWSDDDLRAVEAVMAKYAAPADDVPPLMPEAPFVPGVAAYGAREATPLPRAAVARLAPVALPASPAEPPSPPPAPGEPRPASPPAFTFPRPFGSGQVR